ncbi:hypothetical protein, partial [Burkholderia plantarii]|uniref:hypothetical protein n=1 Tax=Burkholderia plantarii TaxID=41899 RepID=UPI001ABAD081
YSVTGSNAQAADKLHGLVWLPSDFTVLVWFKHTSGTTRGGVHGAAPTPIVAAASQVKFHRMK